MVTTDLTLDAEHHNTGTLDLEPRDNPNQERTVRMLCPQQTARSDVAMLLLGDFRPIASPQHVKQLIQRSTSALSMRDGRFLQVKQRYRSGNAESTTDSTAPGRLHLNWGGLTGQADPWLQWAVPDPACGEPPHGQPDFPVPGRDHGHPGDFRVDRTKLHPLTDILVLSVLAVICGADSFVAIALFGRLNEEWLRTFLALPHGIPSHDTLGRVFARLDAVRFEENFRDWVQATFALTDGQVVPINGKSVRGSHDRCRGLEPLHLVSAWAQANRLVLAQTTVDDHSNEITAIPGLLRMLCLEGCIVTLDAMGYQKTIARRIRAQEADYLMRVRANHQGFHDRMDDTFTLERAGLPPRRCGHGREGVWPD